MSRGFEGSPDSVVVFRDCVSPLKPKGGHGVPGSIDELLALTHELQWFRSG